MQQITRRSYLAALGKGGALVTAAGATTLAACGAPGAGVGEKAVAWRAPVTIKLDMWDYRPDIVRSNLDRFEQENPGIKVEGPETGPCCAKYRERMNTNFLGGYPMDAMYMRDEDVAEWAEAKWILPLDKMPGAAALDKDEYSFVHEQTHYKGTRYGTIYYIGLQTMLYNKAHLQEIGAKEPPSTYTKLRELALQLKRQGVVEFPIWGMPSEGLLEVSYLASGKRMFDAKNNQLFGKDPLFKEIVEWHVRAFQGDGIFGAKPDVQTPFDNGQSSFTWTSFYDLKRLNGQASGATAGKAGGGAAGQLMNAVNPSFVAGKTGGSGICRQYAVAKATKHPMEAWKLISFLGGKDSDGKYSVAKRWWLEQGLWFGYKTLEQDPEVRRSADGWGDIAAAGKVVQGASPRPGITAPWSDQWRTEFVATMKEVFEGKLPVKDGIERGVQTWDQKKADFERTHGR
ncbi:MAG TPA: extracellular solute-binding protein [Chloroflexota bacterium]|nr:extracellular solute-binding protein [Chloroflexota bacterium]